MVAYNAGIKEINRHWPIIEKKRIWGPWPILSFCIMSIEAPIPPEYMSEDELITKKVLSEGSN